MRYFVGLTLIAALGATWSAQAAKPVVTNPDWLARPDGQTVGLVYPKLAAVLHIEGRSVLACDVAASGRLERCEVSEESPKELGFAAAALALAPAFQMRSMTRNGQPVSGGSVRIPIKFKMPLATERSWPPVSERQSAALKAVRVSGLGRAMMAYLSEWMVRMDFNRAVGPEPTSALRGEMIGQFGRALPSGAVDGLTTVARLLASRLTQAELDEINAFFDSDAGKAAAAVEESWGEALNNDAGAKAVLAARKAFCAMNQCATGRDLSGFLRDTTGTNPVVTIASPVWSEQPTDYQTEDAYPQLASALGLGGEVRLTCEATNAGTLGPCNVASERPLGIGFAAAAKKLAPYYRLSEVGNTVVGNARTVPVFVSYPNLQPGPVWADFGASKAPRSQKSMRLAEQLMQLREIGQPATDALKGYFSELERAGQLEGVSDEVLKAVISSIQVAAKEVGAAKSVALAADMTYSLTDAQLESIVMFWRSPAGKAFTHQSAALQGEIGWVAQDVATKVGRTAGRAFCTTHNCMEFVDAPSIPPSSAMTPPRP